MNGTGAMALEGFDWFYFITTGANGMLSNIIVSYALARVLPVKHPRAYWASVVLFTMIILVVKQSAPLMPFAIMGTAGIIVLYMVFLGGSLAMRTAVAMLSQIFLFLAEVPTGILWVALTRAPTMNIEATQAHFLEYVAVSLFHAVLLVALFCWLDRLFRRITAAQSGREKQEGNGFRGGIFILFACVQFLLILLLFLIAFAWVGDSVMLFASLTALCLMYILVDVFLFIRMSDYLASRLANLHAETMARQADEYLQAAASMQESLQEAAVLRHDLRNHLQVVEGLCERGEHQKAQAYLHEAAQLL